MRTNTFNSILITSLISLLNGCSVSVSHPQKGESPFDSHKPSINMSKALINDLKTCRSWAQEQLVKSGLKIYRNQHGTIKECLRTKGWSFSP